MIVHLQTERLIFTGICVIGLLLRIAFFTSALDDHGFLDRIRASPTLKNLVGPWFEIEMALWVIIAPVFAIGMLSFFSPVQPRTIFGLIATAIFTLLMAAVEFIDFRIWYRRRRQLKVKRLNGKNPHA